MKTLYVHQQVMRRLMEGNCEPFFTLYRVMPGEEVEVTDEDEVVSVITRVKTVERVKGLYRVVLEDHATARNYVAKEER